MSLVSPLTLLRWLGSEIDLAERLFGRIADAQVLRAMLEQRSQRRLWEGPELGLTVNRQAFGGFPRGGCGRVQGRGRRGSALHVPADAPHLAVTFSTIAMSRSAGSPRTPDGRSRHCLPGASRGPDQSRSRSWPRFRISFDTLSVSMPFLNTRWTEAYGDLGNSFEGLADRWIMPSNVDDEELRLRWSSPRSTSLWI